MGCALNRLRSGTRYTPLTGYVWRDDHTEGLSNQQRHLRRKVRGEKRGIIGCRLLFQYEYNELPDAGYSSRSSSISSKSDKNSPRFKTVSSNRLVPNITSQCGHSQTLAEISPDNVKFASVDVLLVNSCISSEQLGHFPIVRYCPTQSVLILSLNWVIQHR
jgi:hypothetical protein